MRLTTRRIDDLQTLFAGRRFTLRSAVSIAVWVAVLLAVLLLFLVLLYSPTAALLAVFAGALMRIVGQRLKVRQLLHSSKAADLNTYEFDGQSVRCRFEQSRVIRYINSWTWKIAAALAACGVCFAAQHVDALRLNFPPLQIRNVPWLDWATETGSRGLPVFSAIFFLWANGPERFWTGQVKAAIQARAALAFDNILANREIDGLEKGLEILWQQLGSSQGRVYRSAMVKHLSSHAAEAVLTPEATKALLHAITDLARQDLTKLGAVLASCHKVECRIKSAQSRASTLRNPLQEVRAEELKRGLETFAALAANRQWEECEGHAARLEGQVENIHAQLCQASASVPSVMLAPGTDPYRTLGVSAQTPTASIKKLRLRLAQLYHPDISDGTGNNIKMAEVNAAYDAVMRDRETEGRKART